MTDRKRFALASDHAGFRLKEEVKRILQEQAVSFEDHGTNSEESVDYPDFAEKAIRSVLDGKADQGILVCGSGVGMCITANKFPGIRAALVSEPEAAEMTRKHNDANVLVLPGWSFEREKIERILRAWQETPFEGGRHQRRLDKIRAIEQEVGGPAKKGE